MFLLFNIVYGQGYLFFNNVDTQNGTIEVWIECTDSIAGFQFDLYEAN